MTLPRRVTLVLACAAAISIRQSTPSGHALALAAQDSQDAAARKIAQWVLDRTDGERAAEFLVVLADSADLRGAVTLQSKRDKGRFVRDALFDTAQRTQAPLLEWLRSRRLEHRPFYIVNAIWVRAPRSVVLEIAARPEVARIEGNPQIVNLAPVTLTENERQAAAAAPETIEPGVAYIHAPDVWSQGFTGQGIVIAGADTGVRWDHAALMNHYRGWSGSSADHNYNWHDSIHSGGGSCGPNSAAPCDDHGHGTHTIGTAVGAEGANQIGVAPGATFIACRNMNVGVGTPATYIECMEWFLAPYPVGGTTAQGDPAKAPDITSNSWGCPPEEGCSAGTLQAAIEAQRAAGIMTVVAAGNSGPSCSTVVDPPSLYDAAYTIGAFDASTGTIAGFSSRGPVTIDGSNRPKPDVTAPGVSVRSAVKTTTVSYGSMSGTSMAAPHVSGAVALLWSARPELRHQIALTENILNDAAVDVPLTVSGSSCTSVEFPNNVYGFGRLDIKAAVDLASASISPAAIGFASGGGSGSVTVTAPGGVDWQTFDSVPWITVDSGMAGSGTGTVSYTVAINVAPIARSGSLIIAGRTFRIVQSAPSSLSVSAVTPPARRTSGGQTIVLTGTLASLSSVEVDGVPAVWAYTNGTSEVTVTTSVHAVGSVDITLTPMSGGNFIRVNAFAFLPTTFTDNTLVAGVTLARAQHILELRQAVDALRAVAGLGPAPWVDPALLPGATSIKAAHVLELRAYLEDAAFRLGYPAGSYTDPALRTGTPIKRVHVEELRQRIRDLGN